MNDYVKHSVCVVVFACEIAITMQIIDHQHFFTLIIQCKILPLFFFLYLYRRGCKQSTDQSEISSIN